jgi:hypothetical protein
VGAVAVAVGFAAGLAVPITEREVELMGDARDQAAQRLRSAVKETIRSVPEINRQNLAGGGGTASGTPAA